MAVAREATRATTEILESILYGKLFVIFLIIKVGQRRLLLNGLECPNWPYFILI